MNKTRQSTLKSSIIKTIFAVGILRKNDLIELLTPYSKDPKKYIRELVSKEICIYRENGNLVLLSDKIRLDYSKGTKLRANRNIVDNHSFITAQGLLWFLENKKIKSFEIEKKVPNTTLQSDLFLVLENGFQVYFEADTGTERETELRNKILNYDSIEITNFIVLFITKTQTNFNILTELTRNKAKYKIHLDSKLTEALDKNSYEIDKDVLEQCTVENHIILNNILNTNTSSRISLDEIQKLITSI